MKFLLKSTDPAKLDVDVLILFCFENNLSELVDCDRKIYRLVKEPAAIEDFSGGKEQFLTITTKGSIGAYKLLIVGLGKKKDFDLFCLYEQVASAVRKAKENKPAKVAIIIPDFWMRKVLAKHTIQSTVEAVTLALYQFLKYKSEEEKRKVREIEEFILRIPPNKLAVGEEGMRVGNITSRAVVFARDLVNEPSEVTTPLYLVTVAKDLVKESGGKLKVDIFDEEKLKKLGMSAFLAVAKGSEREARFIRLAYKKKSSRKKIVIIGKGITFDAGGLSLKNSKNMESMKLDMAGAASVIAIFKALPMLNPSIEVVGLIPACENMPSGKALKPGDIVKAMNGKTIEVLNTDAEGRLTLADALSYAMLKEKPDEIIDLATLTHSCMVALGQEYAGLFGNSERLANDLLKSAKLTAEKIWRMPLVKDYKKLVESHIADIKNVQKGRYGGAITAALFLSEFVGKISWVHIDFAGPSYLEEKLPLAQNGGTGYGVRMILHYLSKSSG